MFREGRLIDCRVQPVHLAEAADPMEERGLYLSLVCCWGWLRVAARSLDSADSTEVSSRSSASGSCPRQNSAGWRNRWVGRGNLKARRCHETPGPVDFLRRVAWTLHFASSLSSYPGVDMHGGCRLCVMIGRRGGRPGPVRAQERA